ncbi:PIN domain-containing protein [archaeon]|nr:PIN domain-containing protein [archaeon]
MTRLVIDSSAWIEYLKGSKSADKLNEYFETGELFTTSVCVSEIIAKVLREGLSSNIALQAIRSMSSIISVDAEIGIDAGKIYFELRKTKPKIALSDAITISAAKKLSAKIITFNRDFDGLSQAMVLSKVE